MRFLLTLIQHFSLSEEEATNQEAITAYHAQETTKRPGSEVTLDMKPGPVQPKKLDYM